MHEQPTSSSTTTHHQQACPYLWLVHQQHRVFPGRGVGGHSWRPHWSGHDNRLWLPLLLLLGLLARLLLWRLLLLAWAAPSLSLLSGGSICNGCTWAEPLPLELLPWLVCHGAVQPGCSYPAGPWQQPAACAKEPWHVGQRTEVGRQRQRRRWQSVLALAHPASPVVSNGTLFDIFCPPRAPAASLEPSATPNTMCKAWVQRSTVPRHWESDKDGMQCAASGREAGTARCTAGSTQMQCLGA